MDRFMSRAFAGIAFVAFMTFLVASGWGIVNDLIRTAGTVPAIAAGALFTAAVAMLISAVTD